PAVLLLAVVLLAAAVFVPLALAGVAFLARVRLAGVGVSAAGVSPLPPVSSTGAGGLSAGESLVARVDPLAVGRSPCCREAGASSGGGAGGWKSTAGAMRGVAGLSGVGDVTEVSDRVLRGRGADDAGCDAASLRGSSSMPTQPNGRRLFCQAGDARQARVRRGRAPMRGGAPGHAVGFGAGREFSWWTRC